MRNSSAKSPYIDWRVYKRLGRPQGPESTTFKLLNTAGFVRIFCIYDLRLSSYEHTLLFLHIFEKAPPTVRMLSNIVNKCFQTDNAVTGECLHSWIAQPAAETCTAHSKKLAIKILKIGSAEITYWRLSKLCRRGTCFRSAVFSDSWVLRRNFTTRHEKETVWHIA